MCERGHVCSSTLQEFAKLGMIVLCSKLETKVSHFNISELLSLLRRVSLNHKTHMKRCVSLRISVSDRSMASG